MPDLIYPRDFFEQMQEEERRPLCFVLMPFAEEQREVYDGVIKPTVEECGITCLRADDIYSPGPILVKVMENIARAKVILADLSGRNSNVFYEVGMAHAIRANEDVVLLCRDMEDVPFDLRHLGVIVYKDTTSGFETLKKDLRKAFVSLGLVGAEEALYLTEEEWGIAEADAMEPAAFLSGLRYETVRVVFGSKRDLFGVESTETGAEFDGRVRAALLEWFDYEEIDVNPQGIRFPGGEIAFRGGTARGPTLETTRELKVSLDSIVGIVEELYTEVWYCVGVEVKPSTVVRSLKKIGLPITYASDSQIVVATARGLVDVLLLPETWLRLRAPEDWGYRAKSGVVGYDEMVAFLSGKATGSEFEENLGGRLGRLMEGI